MITAVAPAKINLSLHITGKRRDGYHNLQSLVTFADFGDEITITPSNAPSLTLNGPFSAGLSTTNNIALKALHRVCNTLSIPPNFHIHLTKNIPHGAGLGGGSSDAACIVRMILEHTQCTLPPDTLTALLLELGSDVPVCFYNAPAWMEGRGEIITPCNHLPSYCGVLVYPYITCPTKDLFSQIQPPYAATIPCPTKFNIEALSRLHNDFEEPACALFPSLQSTRSALLETPAVQLVRMSGSGSAWYGLYRTMPEAAQVENDIKNSRPQWFTRPICLKGSVSL